MPRGWPVLACVVWVVAITDAGPAVPHPPTNLTLSYIRSRAVGVTWSAHHADAIHSFRLTVRPLTPMPLLQSKNPQQLTPRPMTSQPLTIGPLNPPVLPPKPAVPSIDGETSVINGQRRSGEVSSLTPETVYEIYIVACNDVGHSNRSGIVAFRTLKDTEPTAIPSHVHLGEILIITALLVAWLCAVIFFLHKWGTIRITQSGQSYKQPPKNLDSIKVVAKATDSVITSNYTPQMTRTMAARQKHIEHMNNIPEVQVEDNSAGESSKD